MEAEPGAKHEFTEKSGQFWLWLGLLLPPLAWSLHLQTIYLLIEHACGTDNFGPIHIVSAILLAISIVGGLISWRLWLKAGGGWKSEKGNAIDRSRFMAILGMLLSALLSTLVFAQWLPVIMGVPCSK